MDAIIRAAEVSGTRWQLRRRAGNAAAPAVAAPQETPVPSAPVPAPSAPQVEAAAPLLPAGPAVDEEAAAAVAAREQQWLARQQEQEREHEAALARLEQEQNALAQAQAKTAAELDAALQEAAGRGYREGLEKGQREAGEAAAAQAERIARLAQAATQARRTLLAENEDMLVEIAFAAVCRILGSQAASRDGLAAMVGQLAAAAGSAPTVVRVHPQDAELLEPPAATAELPGWQVKGDASIELGGCMLDGPHGTLDARLEVQLQQLRAALLQARQARARSEEAV